MMRATLRRPAAAVPRDAESGFAHAVLPAAVAVLTAAVAVTDFVAAPGLFLTLAKLLLIFGCGLWLRVLGCGRIGALFHYLALLGGSSGALALLTTVVAAGTRPYADPLLAAADARLFGLDWDDVRTAAFRHDRTMAWLSAAYRCLDIQPFLLVALLVARRRFAELVRFVNAWTIAICLSIAVFAFLPAQGIYLFHGVPIGAVPGLSVHVAWNDVHVLDAIRAGGYRVLDGEGFYGLVTFPSFHAAGAVLLGWGFRTTPGLALPAVAVNAAMFVSAVFVGGHYVVDLLGGTVVALVAIRVATVLVPRLGHTRTSRTAPVAALPAL